MSVSVDDRDDDHGFRDDRGTARLDEAGGAWAAAAAETTVRLYRLLMSWVCQRGQAKAVAAQ
jgi:hypothetical protein